jgi:hypothetical protein
MRVDTAAPLRALPLFGIFTLPQLLPIVLPEFRALGANALVIVISDHDRLRSRHTISTVLRNCVLHGYRVYLSLEESSSRSFDRSYLNSYVWLSLVAKENGCEGIYVDRTHGNTGGILILQQLSSLCRGRELKLFVTSGIAHSRDHDLIAKVSCLKLIDTLSIVHEYDISLNPPLYVEHAELAIARIRDCVEPSQHLATVISPEIFRSHTSYLAGIVQSWRNVGIKDVVIWGGFCSNQAFPNSNGRIGDHGYGYDHIASAFGRKYLYTKHAAEFSSLTD